MADDSIDALPRTHKAALEVGSKRYFTGDPCSKGHTAARTTSNRECLECARARFIANYRENPELGRERARKHKRLWRSVNIEKDRAATRSWREGNIDKARAATRAWAKANPAKRNAQHQNRRAHKRSAEGKHTSADIAAIRKAQKDRCAMPDCRTKLKGKGHVDHIKSLSKGGSNWPSNLQLLCDFCNGSKHNRDPIEFAQSRGFLV